MPHAELDNEKIVLTDIALRDRDATHKLLGYSYKSTGGSLDHKRPPGEPPF